MKLFYLDDDRIIKLNHEFGLFWIHLNGKRLDINTLIPDLEREFLALNPEFENLETAELVTVVVNELTEEHVGYTVSNGVSYTIFRLKKEYANPVYWVYLKEMKDDPFPVPPGSWGEIKSIDDAGQIHVLWQDGRQLAVIPGVDDFEILIECKEGDEVA